MGYIIYNGDNYLYQNKKNSYEIVHDVNKATKWEKLQSANNVCKNMNQSKNFKNYHLKVKYVVQNNGITYEPHEVKLDYDILEKVKEISEFAKQLEDRKIYLMDMIHKIDLEIVDIEHAAEFYNLSASQGYKLYKMLHNARIKRRELKNELEKIGFTLGASIKSDSMENLKNSIIGLDSREYEPRVNKELFGV